MSFEQLQQHASEIAQKAAQLEIHDKRSVPTDGPHGSGPPPHVDEDGIKAKFANIPSMFQPWTSIPDPANYNGMLQALSGAMLKVSCGQATQDPIDHKPYAANPNLDKITSVAGYVDGWDGDAALKFKHDFLDPFKSIAENQFIALSTLKGALEAHQAMWNAARHDIDELAHKTLHALDVAMGSDQGDLSFAFSVMSAIAAVGGVALAPVTGGASAAIVFSAVGAAASVGSAGVAGAKAVGGGASADEIVKSMKDSIDKLKQEVHDAEAKIQKALDGIEQDVAGNAGLFVSKRPALAGMDAGDATSGKGLGHHE